MPQLQIPAVEPADALSNLERSESSVSPAVLDRARKLLDALHRLGAPTPFIFPTEFGGIQFEWHGGRFELDLEILRETETKRNVPGRGGRPMSNSEFCHAHARVRIARARAAGLKVYDDREVRASPGD